MADFLSKEKQASPTPEVSNSSSFSGAESTPEKLDDDELKSRLTKIEDNMQKAQSKGNRSDLEQILADEFTNIDGEGKKYNKTQWLNEFKDGNPDLKSWSFTDTKLEANTADTAIMSFVVTYNYKDGTKYKTRDIDKFVNRDERWQIVSSQSTEIK